MKLLPLITQVLTSLRATAQACLSVSLSLKFGSVCDMAGFDQIRRGRFLYHQSLHVRLILSLSAQFICHRGEHLIASLLIAYLPRLVKIAFFIA